MLPGTSKSNSMSMVTETADILLASRSRSIWQQVSLYVSDAVPINEAARIVEADSGRLVTA